MNAETTVWACKKCGRCGKAEQCSCGGSRAQLAESDARRRFMESHEPETGWYDDADLTRAWREAEENDDEPGPDPNAIDDSVKCCPDCDKPNQFGEVCASCQSDRDDEARDRAAEDAAEWEREKRENGYDDAPCLPEPWWWQR